MTALLLSQTEAAAPWLWVALALLSVVATAFWLAGRGGDNARIPPGKTTGRDDPHWEHGEFIEDEALKRTPRS